MDTVHWITRSRFVLQVFVSLLLLLSSVSLSSCGYVEGPRGGYVSYVAPDRRPPLIKETRNADALWGPADSAARGDGIAESRRADLQAMVERFAPTVVLARKDYVRDGHRRHRLLPVDAWLLADTLSVDRIRAAPFGFADSLDIDLRALSSDSMAALTEKLLLYESDPDVLSSMYFDFPGENPRHWWESYARFRTGPDSARWSQPTVYAHPFVESDGRVVIQYWFLFPFNDFIGNHEGDWEHINVVLTPDRSAVAEVHYYFHHRSVRLPQGRFRPQIVDGTHTVTWAGGRMYSVLDFPIRIIAHEGNEGSHGNFPFPGEWEAAAGLGAPESVTGVGKDSSRVIAWDRFRVILMPEPVRIDYQNHPDVLRDWLWLVLPVRWGFPIEPSLGSELKAMDVGNRAPFGPPFNDAWNRTAPGLMYPDYQLKRVPALRSVVEDLLQPWYWAYAFRMPRYINDTRGSLDRKRLEALRLVPRGGWHEVGLGAPLLGVSIGYPLGDFKEKYPHSFGFTVWRNFWAKARLGGVELVGGYQKFSRRDGGSLFVYPLTASFVARMPDALFRPYASLGGGVYGWEARERTSPDSQLVTSGWSLGWTGSAGLEYYLRPNVALDVSLRYHYALHGPGAFGGINEEPLRFLALWVGHYVRF